jgi:hypothetical protein
LCRIGPSSSEWSDPQVVRHGAGGLASTRKSANDDSL